MRNSKDRWPVDPWAFLAWLLVMVALVFVLTSEAVRPVPQAPTAQERAAQLTAQERYYEALDLYGDMEGAVEAARVVYGMEVLTP